MFRASPWISYEPAESKPRHGSPPDPTKPKPSANNMDEDIEMDAPQISILRDEESPPPPPPTRTSKFRVKLLVNDAKPVPGSPASTSGKPSTGSRDDPPLLGEDEDEEDDEEDQLMDDENPVNPVNSSTLPKRRPPSKRKPKRNDKRAGPEDEKKARPLPPAVVRQDVASEENRKNLAVEPPPESSSIKTASSKRVASIRSTAQRSKGKAVPRAPAVPIYDDGNLTETYSGTAASSPAPFHLDGSPEPENFGPLGGLTEDINLDSMPVPLYPLPTKPFPVQPPPKIGTGFAPIIPLDKSHKKPRHWRVANREIRGIAGGRWFARSWVGDKESEYATAVANGTNVPASKSTDGMVLPKLPSVPISAISSAKGTGRQKAGTGSASHSRASSTMPDRDRDSHATRAPTRMRSSILAGPPSEAGNDSDMAVTAGGP